MSRIKDVYFKELCQACGLKATNQRFIIFYTLSMAENHPTADQLFSSVSDKLQGISRDTIYRTLNILAEHGVVRKLTMPGGAARFDGNRSPHHHFLCVRCGRVMDFKWPDFDMLPWPATVSEQWLVKAASVLLMGHCLKCEKK